MKPFPLIVFICYFYPVYGKVYGVNIKNGSNWYTSSNESAIVGGVVTYIRRFPSAVSILVSIPYTEKYCTGSIISPKFVLTAAHCFDIVIIVIRLGVGSRKFDGGITHFATEFHHHPGYDAKTLEFDIAVVKPENDITTNNHTVKPIQLPLYKQRLSVRSIIYAIGWGYTSEKGEKISEDLRAVKLPVRPLTQCKTLYKDVTEISPYMLCAGYLHLSGIGICNGDSGGPAINKRGTQVGILAGGKGCGRAGFPAIYTNVALLRNWIRKVTEI